MRGFAAANDAFRYTTVPEPVTYRVEILPAAPPPNPRDLNGDGKVNDADVVESLEQMLGRKPCTNANINTTEDARLEPIYGRACTIFDLLDVMDGRDPDPVSSRMKVPQ